MWNASCEKKKSKKMKKEELLKSLIETQKQINESLKGLKEDLKPKYEGLTSTICRIDKLDNYIESNVYSKEQTVEAINKEIDYRQDYETWKDEESDLVDLVEKYCKYNNKYEAIDLFKEIDKEYQIKRRKEK